jgi:hypothetical protein
MEATKRQINRAVESGLHTEEENFVSMNSAKKGKKANPSDSCLKACRSRVLDCVNLSAGTSLYGNFFLTG